MVWCRTDSPLCFVDHGNSQVKVPGCSGLTLLWSSLDSLSYRAKVLGAVGRPNPGYVFISLHLFDFIASPCRSLTASSCSHPTHFVQQESRVTTLTLVLLTSNEVPAWHPCWCRCAPESCLLSSSEEAPTLPSLRGRKTPDLVNRGRHSFQGLLSMWLSPEVSLPADFGWKI